MLSLIMINTTAKMKTHSVLVFWILDKIIWMKTSVSVSSSKFQILVETVESEDNIKQVEGSYVPCFNNNHLTLAIAALCHSE